MVLFSEPSRSRRWYWASIGRAKLLPLMVLKSMLTGLTTHRKNGVSPIYSGGEGEVHDDHLATAVL